MSTQLEIKRLPRKTVITIVILVIVGILSMFIVKDGKSKKATKILYELGFIKIKDVVVFSKTEFLNEDSNIKGYQYALKFVDLDKNLQCNGFILKDFKGKIAKDLDCKGRNK